MAGKVLDFDQVLLPDNLGTQIANTYMEWETRRQPATRAWEEIQRYLFSTDTTTTSNSKLPWKNKTVTPKLTQIRDNLFANYEQSIWPKRKYLYWEAFDEESGAKAKKEAARVYMNNVIQQPMFKDRFRRILLDYIDYGNCFAGVEWVDDRQIDPQAGTYKAGYVGPMPVRISPVDIVMNPIAPDFQSTPKIIRTLVSVGELAGMVEQLSSPDIDAKAIFDYCVKLRQNVYTHTGTFNIKNPIFAIAGFNDYVGYLKSNYVELLTFYGDLYDVEKNKFYKNSVCIVVDRHKVISMETNPSSIGENPIYHSGWRIRQDNLYAQGPLEGLVGLQYRIDHLENLKADVYDLIAAPPLKIKGLVEEFQWAPFARIYVGDDGDVEVLAPESNVLQANTEIQYLMNLMEEMAGSPKEAAGFRTPGEKTAYEVQRLENAASRIFSSKIVQFEEMMERLFNGMLEMARRKMDQSLMIRTMDDELNVENFFKITPEDLAANGRIKPVAARNFAERAEKIQNISNFYASALGADPAIQAHISSIKAAQMVEDLLDLKDYELVTPYIRLSEQQEAQSLSNAGEEQNMMATATPSGLTPDDTE